MHGFDQKGLATGAIYIVFGAVVALGAQQYPVGGFHRMGPGFFPLMISLGLVAVGLVVVALSVARAVQPVALGRWSWRNLVLVTLALVAFALLIRPGGVILATAAMVAIASRAARDLKPRETLISLLVLLVLIWLLFLKLLGLQLTMLPRGLGF